jgi:CRISPR-associated protein Cmr2
MVDYRQKLYAFLKTFEQHCPSRLQLEDFSCLQDSLENLSSWWNQVGSQTQAIAQSSDRLTFHNHCTSPTGDSVEVRHPLSGQAQLLSTSSAQPVTIPDWVKTHPDAQTVFLWFWRFYPDLLSMQGNVDLLFPVDRIMPDCSLHSYCSTVSALAGAISSQDTVVQAPPYLILFTFSPVQEFIKSSRKFLDFWAGSYLLHYLSARLCWYIAQHYGPDAVITPALWGQEIIDAFLSQEPSYSAFVANFPSGKSPADRFQQAQADSRMNEEATRYQSTSLCTAGFPNTITALIPSKEQAQSLCKELETELRRAWQAIGTQVRATIKQAVMETLYDPAQRNALWTILQPEFGAPSEHNPYYHEFQKWQQANCWEWNKLWDSQLAHTWECYWVVVPLGKAPLDLEKIEGEFDAEWLKAQSAIAQPRTEIPTAAEQDLYDRLNIGTWWGTLQARLGQVVQAVKNTRTWQIPTAPGERSTLSGQASAVHPNLNYTIVRRDGIERDLREGGGLPASSMRLFWRIMAEVFPGLFNGSEKLNAIELTKRMAWVYGGVATSLGINIQTAIQDDASENRIEDIAENLEVEINEAEVNSISSPIDYEKLIRFPNLSSIAAARFLHDAPHHVDDYWRTLSRLIHSPTYRTHFSGRQRGLFRAKTKHRCNVPKTDRAVSQTLSKTYNGVMFSGKWLADDMGLEVAATNVLQSLVDQAHKEANWGDGSPADWWVLIKADGDSMGEYITGRKLQSYQHYIVNHAIDELSQQNTAWATLMQETIKRMGPATHIGFNRALLDFSNRLVPYLTEQRFCGRVIYSGGDDVMVVLPLADLPEFLLSLRSAWCGGDDPEHEFISEGGYWKPDPQRLDLAAFGLPARPLFTMGKSATMSMGIVVAHKSVPLPTVLEQIWDAETERAKQLLGSPNPSDLHSTAQKLEHGQIPHKDGLCFRVIYGSGNTLEALLKGHLLAGWWDWMQKCVSSDPVNETTDRATDLSPLLHRLAEELPKHTCLTESDRLLSKAAYVILNQRDQPPTLAFQESLLQWLDGWEEWALAANRSAARTGKRALGADLKSLGQLLRFSAFWVSRYAQQQEWRHS